jgi:uncharacterized protein (TIGR00369 family)
MKAGGMAIEHKVGYLSHHIGQVTEEWQEGYCKLTVELGEQHINRSGAIDGGVFAILIDSAAAYAGTFAKTSEPRNDCATISMNVNFAGQPSGKRLVAEGHVRRSGKRIFFASCTVTDEDGTLCAFGDCTFRIFSPR